MEDARLARAITAILFTPRSVRGRGPAAWLDTVTRAFAHAAPGPVPPWAFNTFATLQSLHLHLALGLADRGTPPHTEAVTTRITTILRAPFPWLA